MSVYGAFIHQLVEFKDGHQFHGVYTQRLQIGDFFTHPAKCAGSSYIPGHFCKSPDMEFIDDKILDRRAELGFHAPVEIVFDNSCPIAALLDFLSPGALSGDGFGIGIDQNIFFVKDQSLFRFIRSIQAEGIFKFLHIQTKHNHGKNVADPVTVRDGEYSIWLFGFPVKEKDLTGEGILGMDREADAARNGPCAEIFIEPGTDGKAFNRIQWFHMLWQSFFDHK